MTKAIKLLMATSFILIISMASEAFARGQQESVATLYKHKKFRGMAVELKETGAYELEDLRALGIDYNEISSIKLKRGYQITVFKHGDLGGDEKTFTKSKRELGNFNNQISSLVVEPIYVDNAGYRNYPDRLGHHGYQGYNRKPYKPAAVLFQHSDYAGYAVPLAPGQYNLRSLRELGMKNDDISSIKVSAGYKISVYQHNNFRGWKKTYQHPKSWLGKRYNDQISSVIVEKVDRPHRRHANAAATLYQHADYRGYAVYLEEGKYSMAELIDLGMKNDDISSIQVHSGYKVIVYQHDKFRGWRKSFKHDTNWVGKRYNDQISSVVVKRVRGYSDLYQKPAVELFSRRHFQGKSVALSTGYYSARDLKRMGIDHGDISSFKVDAGYQITLFQQDYLQLGSKTFYGDKKRLGGKLKQQVISVLIEKAPAFIINRYEVSRV